MWGFVEVWYAKNPTNPICVTVSFKSSLKIDANIGLWKIRVHDRIVAKIKHREVCQSQQIMILILRVLLNFTFGLKPRSLPS